MSPKQLALRWFQEVWNNKNPKVIHEMLRPDATGHTEGGVVVGPAEFEEQMFKVLHGAFPDFSIVIDGCVAEDDDVAIRWTVTGTQKGALLGIPASNRKVTFSGSTWLRFSDGKLVEGWDRWNAHGLIGLLRDGIPSASARMADS